MYLNHISRGWSKGSSTENVSRVLGLRNIAYIMRRYRSTLNTSPYKEKSCPLPSATEAGNNNICCLSLPNRRGVIKDSPDSVFIPDALRLSFRESEMYWVLPDRTMALEYCPWPSPWPSPGPPAVLAGVPVGVVREVTVTLARGELLPGAGRSPCPRGEPCPSPSPSPCPRGEPLMPGCQGWGGVELVWERI